MQPAARLVVVASLMFTLLSLSLNPGKPVGVSAQALAPAEQPQRIFQDLLVAPHQGLGQATGAALSGVGEPDPKEVALSFVRDSQAMPTFAAAELKWEVEASEPLDQAITVVRLAQSKNAIPIFGAGLAVQVEGNAVRSISGAYMPAVAAASKPAISLDEAFKAAREALAIARPEGAQAEAQTEDDPLAKPVLTESELIYFNPALFDLAPEPTALAYRLVVTTPDGNESMTVIIDAQNAKVRLSYANYAHALNRVIRDANGVMTLNAANCYNEAGPIGTASGDCVAAFQNTGATYNYFFTTHGRDSYNNAGAMMIAVVRYGSAPNAFWDGQVTAYGPGFATRDVVAHEWTHAVTQYTAGLIYQNQSGALNESLSDIFGAMVDRSDWQMGEDTPIGVIRDLANPTLYNQPDRVSAYVCTTEDNGGVHINSGIPNKLAYLIADGGTFNGRSITGVGREATERIFYRALVGGLSQRSTFSDLNNALLAAAAALYGQSSAQYVATNMAAQAIELSQPIPCGGTATPDPFEDDDNPAQARSIATDGSLHQPHTFHEAGDQDWLHFTATAGASYTIETLGLQTATDTVLALFAADGVTRLAINDDASPGNLASRITWVATTGGTLFVQVSNYGDRGGTNTGYQVRITGSVPQTQSDAFEPDNSAASARPITVGGAAQDHNFHIQGDLDWVSFSAVTGVSYIIETFELGPLSDTVLELYNSAGTLLSTNDDTPGSLASRISWVAPADGVYKVQVRHFAGASGATTSYRLRVLSTMPLGDAYEPDNSFTSAKPISAGGASQQHTFHIPHDEDWVYFDATPDNAYTIETLNLAMGNDTMLWLYASDGTLLDSNDDYGGLASRISYTPGSAQRLTVRARHFSSTAGGLRLNYDLRVVVTPLVSPDVQEPDDTPAQARQQIPGPPEQPTTARFNLHQPGDQDWSWFTAIAGNRYIIETSNLEARADTILSLYDNTNPSPIITDDDGGEGLASRIVWLAPTSGTYFIQVRGFSSGTNGVSTGYTLRLSTYGTPGTPDAFEDDNVPDAAKSIINGAAGQTHNFHSIGDHDWVVFSATRGTEYTLSTSQLGTRSDTYLELYDSSGTNRLVFNDDDSGSLASRIIWTAPTDGNYKARVRHFNPQISGPNTNYTLSLFGQSDSYEPDNSLGAAKPIQVNATEAQAHNFHTAGDQDWVSFNAQSNTAYTLATSNLGICGDTVLELYNPDGTQLAVNDDYNGLASQIVWLNQSNGTLFVKVRHFSSAASGSCASYDLRVSGMQVSSDSYEPDNTRLSATPIVVNGPGQNHTIHVAGDQDWVSFNSISGWTYTLATSNLGTCGDTVLELFDQANNTLAVNDDYSGLSSRILWIARANEPLFARVRHFSSSTAGACTSYTLTASRAEVALDAFEPDETPATATTLNIGSAQIHSFHTTTDPDWVRFAAVQGTTYTMYTFNLGANADTILTLYDNTGSQQLAYNDDYTTGQMASRIVWTAPATGDYTLLVRPFGVSGGRPDTNYSLSIFIGAALAAETPAVPAGPTVRVIPDDDSGLPLAGDGQLRLTGVEVHGTIQVGAEFTTIVQATGSAADFKLRAGAKSATLALVAIEPLSPSGAPLDLGKRTDGPPWAAQSVSQSDLAVYEPWSSAEEGALVALRWRVIAQPASKELELPISLVGRDEGGTWQGGTVSVAMPVASEIKVDAVSPAEQTLSEQALLSIQISGLGGELPKVYLVDVSSLAEQQIVDLSYAPGSSDTLIAKLDLSFKPGIYKVRALVASGASATSSGTVHLLAPGQAPSTPEPDPSPKPEESPSPETTVTPVPTPRRVFLPFTYR